MFALSVEGRQVRTQLVKMTAGPASARFRMLTFLICVFLSSTSTLFTIAPFAEVDETLRRRVDWLSDSKPEAKTPFSEAIAKPAGVVSLCRTVPVPIGKRARRKESSSRSRRCRRAGRRGRQKRVEKVKVTWIKKVYQLRASTMSAHKILASRDVPAILAEFQWCGCSRKFEAGSVQER